MPDSTHPKSSVSKSKKKSDHNGQSPVGGVFAVKEQEPSQTDRATSKIYERQNEADRKAEEEIQQAIGKEGRLREPEIKIPPDVADAGVVSPETEASETLSGDTTVELPMTEDEFKLGEHAKVDAKVTEKKEVLGVASLVALALFVGRLIKLAHYHAKRIVFRKGDD